MVAFGICHVKCKGIPTTLTMWCAVWTCDRYAYFDHVAFVFSKQQKT